MTLLEKVREAGSCENCRKYTGAAIYGWQNFECDDCFTLIVKAVLEAAEKVARAYQGQCQVETGCGWVGGPSTCSKEIADSIRALGEGK